MLHILLVFVGGGLGAVARHTVGLVALRTIGPGFPWGTLTANIVGGLLMGLLAGTLALKISVPAEIRLLLATGFLGGFTTFSSFSLEAVLLWERGATMPAVGYVAVSVVGAIAALVAGLWIARAAFA